MNHPHSNQLINETSPYLLQHAHNPVNWFPWGAQALQKAKDTNKIILVSIGYSACHWCHVMERESFEDETVAEIMNEHFINIKIDREERPDLDHIYMDAVQAMTGSGGWPLNVFLTPGTKPFYGGTYFPPVKMHNRSSWKEVLLAVSNAWKERSNEIETQAGNLMAHLEKSNNIGQTNLNLTGKEGQEVIVPEEAEAMFSTIMAMADQEWGGFGKAPKFPQTFTIQFLLLYHYFTGNNPALQQATLSLDKMLQGGIYDHLSGGLARYSTDSEWLAPHFEKMLYDNALLVIALCDAYQLTAEKKYETAIRKTLDFVKRELLHPGGGFYSALDADSEGEEGKYYVWQKKEIENLLGKDAAIIVDFFDVKENGNWEGKNILRVLLPVKEYCSKYGLNQAEFENLLQKTKSQLLAEREKRSKPGLDDKILLGWNALMLKAFARAYSILREEEYRLIAEANARFIFKELVKPGSFPKMLHTFKAGVAKYPAFLDDYAFLIDACIQLYEISFDPAYLEKARQLTEYVVDGFSDEEDILFFFTHVLQNDIIVRKKETYDGAIASGNSVMAGNLMKLGICLGKPQWHTRGEKMLIKIAPFAIKYPGSFGVWASLLLQQMTGVNEIAVVGPDFFSVGRGIHAHFIPHKVLMASPGENTFYPLLSGKPEVPSTLIYMCKNYTCLAPFENVEMLSVKIAEMNKKCW